MFRGQLVLESPDYEILDDGQASIHTGRMVPIYPLTDGLTGRNLRRITWQALQEWLGGIDELLPADVLKRTGLVPLPEAIRQAHDAQPLALPGALAGVRGARPTSTPEQETESERETGHRPRPRGGRAREGIERLLFEDGGK